MRLEHEDLSPFSTNENPGGFFQLPHLDELGSLDINELDYLSGKLIVNKNYIQDKINIIKRKPDKTQEDYNLLQKYNEQVSELNNYILHFFDYYKRKEQRGQGLMYYNKPEKLIKRLELLDGSLSWK